MPGIMKNKKLLCSVCFLFAFMSALWGQNITVKGNVTSKTDGQPPLSVLLSLKLQLQPTEQLQTSMVISLFQFRSTLL